MTINKIVSNLRSLIKQQTDDSIFSDEFLYSLFNDARVALLSTKKYKISRQDIVSFCMDLEESKAHACGVTLTGCDVLRSKYPIPGYIDVDKKIPLKVAYVGGKIISEILEQDVDLIPYNRILNKKLSYTLINNYVIIWKNCKVRFPKSIIVEAAWQDLLDWTKIQSTDKCVDILNMEVFLDKKIIWDAYSVVMDILKLPLSIPEDDINDTNSPQ